MHLEKVYRIILVIFLVSLHCIRVAAASRVQETSVSLKDKNVSEIYNVALRMDAKGETSRALAYYNAVCGRYSETMADAEKRLCATSYYKVAEVCASNRQYSLAMNHYLSALGISDRSSFNTLTAQIYVGIGNLYSSHSDYAMGIRFYEKALQLANGSKNKRLINRILNNLVGASCFSGRMKDGLKYFRLLRQSGEPSTEYHFNLLMCEGLINNNLGKTQIAITLYRKALGYSVAEKLNKTCEEAANSCLSQIYIDEEELDSALCYLHRNEAMALQTGNKDLLEETYRQLSGVYKKRGDSALAAEYKVKHVELSDSLLNDEEFNAMKNAQFLYEADKSANTITFLTQEKQSREKLILMQRRWILTLVFAFVLFVVLLVFLYRQKRMLYNAYKELYIRSQEYLHSDTKMPQEKFSRQTDNSGPAANTVAETDKDPVAILTDRQRETLLHEVERVMETTTDYCQSDFSLERLAAMIGSNSRYVSEAINEGYGKNFRTYLNEYRIKEAMRRLADTEHYGGLTIKAISESVGYKSQANFITVFTRMTGMKPSIYQKLSKT